MPHIQTMGIHCNQQDMVTSTTTKHRKPWRNNNNNNNQPTNQPTNQPNKQTNKQTTNNKQQTTNQPTNQPTNQTNKQTNKQQHFFDTHLIISRNLLPKTTMVFPASLPPEEQPPPFASRRHISSYVDRWEVSPMAQPLPDDGTSRHGLVTGKCYQLLLLVQVVYAGLLIIPKQLVE